MTSQMFLPKIETGIGTERKSSSSIRESQRLSLKGFNEGNDDNIDIDFKLKSNDEEEDVLKTLRTDTLDDYIYDEYNPIASGSFGKVYRAILRNATFPDGREVAIKIMEPKNTDLNTGVKEEHLIQEYNLKFILNDDCESHLVCYYDVFKYNTRDDIPEKKFVLIMTLITGKELLMEEYDTEDKEIITKQLLSALKTLHSNGVNHRDIKAENIVYDKEKKYTTLLDYGLSCAMPKIPIEVRNCEENRLAGTAVYIDPRIVKKFRGKKNISFDDSQKGDLYSLGIVLYFLWSDDYELLTIKKEDQHQLLISQKTDYIIKNLDKIKNEKIRELIRNLIIGESSIEEIIQQYE